MRMGTILVGTCGYSYDDWKGPFYPDTIAKTEYLHYYSMFLRFTELDFSYYRMPEARSLASLAARVPEDFRFAIKAHRSMTHGSAEEAEDGTPVFGEAARALLDSGKLAAVLLQFPYSFHRTDANRERLARLCDGLADFPLAVEFRNADWDLPKVDEELSRRGVARVMADLPELGGLPRPGEPAEGPLAYARFHGRNAERWWDGDAAERYDYLYSEAELRLWLPRLRAAASRSRLVLAAFNNHRRGQAVSNARALAGLLQ